MKIERIELDDCGSPERLLIAIFKQIPDMPIPVPVEEIAHQVGITEIRAITTTGFEGGLITNASKSVGAILVNSSSRDQRRRFTIGHELGHLLIPTHQPLTLDGFRCTSRDFSRQSASAGDRAAKMEVEANRFSAGLLVPAKQFRDDMRQWKEIDLSHVVELAARYKVSKEAMARRYVEQHDDPCAIVVSQNAKVLRIYRHRQFPYVSLKPGQVAPAGSLTVDYAGGKSISNWRRAACECWLSPETDWPEDALSEQVLIQSSGYRLTLLSIEIDNADEAEEEAELRETWAVRFRGRR